MCVDPVSLAAVGSLAVSGLSGIATMASNDQKFGQQEQQYNQNYQNSLAANRSDENALTQRQMQEAGATSQKEHLALVEGAQKSAQFSVSAAGGGVTGLSVDNLIAGVKQQTSDNLTTLNTNWKNTAAQLQSQKDAAVNTEDTRINSVSDPVEASPIGTLLGVAGTGLKSYGTIESRGGAASLGITM